MPIIMEDTVEHFVKELKNMFLEQIATIKELEEAAPVYKQLHRDFSAGVQQYLMHHKIRLYSHQIEALEYLDQGKNVIITTPTASGKSLVYLIAMFEEFVRDSQATALYLSPLKALARDQLVKMEEWDRITGAKAFPAVYDGDTSPQEKQKIRSKSRLILSNPYAFHQYLDWHTKWRRIFSHLKFIVIDEAHVYRGIFGSGFAHFIRRLRRILHFYRSEPQFILVSATLGNSRLFAEKLVGLPFVEVDKSGAPQSKRIVTIWNPKIINKQLGTRVSAFVDASRLLAELVKRHLQTLVFVDSRKMAELLALWTRERLSTDGEQQLAEKITAYRAGYLPQDRRKLEVMIRLKQVLGITATSALELGIDIGSLDSVMLVGYPGSIVQTWQRIGRAGRQHQNALIFLVCHNNPLDQYIAKHPEHIFYK